MNNGVVNRLHQVGKQIGFDKTGEEERENDDKEIYKINREDIIKNHYGIFLPKNINNDEPWVLVRSAISPQKLWTGFPPPFDEIRTYYDILNSSFIKHAKLQYLGTRIKKDDGTYGEYEWITYNEADVISNALGSALCFLGLERGDTVGIYSKNCKEWVLLDAGCQKYSLVSVPLYDTLGSDSVEYICNHASISIIGCSSTVLKTLLKCLPKCSSIRYIIIWDSKYYDKHHFSISDSPVQIITIDDAIELGKRNQISHIPPKADDLMTLCYTSGTTGIPKGAMISHSNVVANAGSIRLILPAECGSKHLSYLPLAHIYERITLCCLTFEGTSIGFYHGNPLEILDDIKILKPDYFLSVPRVYNRIYDKVMLQIMQSNPFIQSIFKSSYSSKVAKMMGSSSSDSSPMNIVEMIGLDKLVFNKIKTLLGGNLKFLTTGASPISDEVFQFLKACFDVDVYEGYGMTESTCTITITNPNDKMLGHVGSPIPCTEVLLCNVLDMNYLITDKPYPRGEICIRGPAIFKGYYNNKKETDEAFDDEGWFHTGDIGMWLEGGRLKIIDRKKNLFKLSQGEYIAPEKIENLYSKCHFVSQIFVYGDSLKDKLVAIVVPDAEVLVKYCQLHGKNKSLGELCYDEKIIKLVFDEMESEAIDADLRGFEKVYHICLIPEPFSVENDLLTPTFKLKRMQAKEKFKNEIKKLYDDLSSR